LKLSDNAETVLQKRYYINGEDWDGLCWRVANAVGKDEASRKEYFDAINNLYFLPNSPTLMNAGTELNNLSACFVLPLDDSMDSIMDCAKSMAKVFKSGGGCGISLDKLREKDSSVGSTSGAASGVVSFMQLYDTVANTVKQGGKRRAAIISSLRVDHPEILDFIDCKTDLKKFNNMNISVAITDKFMKAVENNQDYDLVSPVNGVVGKLNAREVFMKIATNAHQSGEPGLIFLDTANKLNPIPQFGKYATTNPCGEIFLLPNEACNLLSLNLNKINDDNIDYYVRLSVRFLNDVIDCGKYPLPEIQEQVSLTRKIGLGIMGWADLLASKMIPYDSPKARHLADSLSRQIHEIAHDESVMLAIKNNKYIETTEGKRYNGTLLTIAPTGTISMIADVSSSIEPYFALCYTKNVMDGHSLKYINPILQSTLEKEGLWCSEVKAQIAKTGSIQNIDTIPQSIKDVFKTANEISVGGHVKMQAAFQKNIDNSISKSINLPNSATVEDVLHAYGLAYNLGVKGITVYRDGSRNNQVLTSPKSRIERCPECSSKEISHESGCVACRNCGWSKCSI
jgi:ribonucleoside-diphosphate reductase alpha chain